jgi:glutamate racemase
LIGVFDSGIGGLSVYREIRRLLPDAGTVYLADQGFGMYGDRTLDEVRQRSVQMVERLLAEAATTVVVACNSASAAALDELRTGFPGVPFVGMEPAVKPAAGITENGTIGVLATKATFQGKLFASLVDRYVTDQEVVTVACQGLAAAIETDDPITNALIEGYVGELERHQVDVVVLGCTHYSLVADRIAHSAAPATLIDPAPAVARQVARVADGGGSGTVRFITTGDEDRFSDQLERLGFA